MCSSRCYTTDGSGDCRQLLIGLEVGSRSVVPCSARGVVAVRCPDVLKFDEISIYWLHRCTAAPPCRTAHIHAAHVRQILCAAITPLMRAALIARTVSAACGRAAVASVARNVTACAACCASAVKFADRTICSSRSERGVSTRTGARSRNVTATELGLLAPLFHPCAGAVYAPHVP